MPTKFKLKSGEKYALISINCDISDRFPEEIQIDTDVWIKRSFPFKMDKHWKAWLGSFTIKEIQNSNFYLITKCKSKSPESLDGDNNKLIERINHFFWAITLVDFLKFRNYFSYQLTGAKNSTKVDIRSVRDINNPIDIKDSPRIRFTEKHARLVSIIGNSLQSLNNTIEYSRFHRSLNSFWNGILASRFTEKYHQYIRCIEGFIHPEKSNTTKQFASRVELFLGANTHDFSRELYQIRCAIEHLNDPLGEIKRVKNESVETTFLKKAIAAEGIARYCLLRFLSDKKLWEHFQDDHKINQFWKLTNSERQKIWGISFKINKISAGMLQMFD